MATSTETTVLDVALDRIDTTGLTIEHGHHAPTGAAEVIITRQVDGERLRMTDDFNLMAWHVYDPDDTHDPGYGGEGANNRAAYICDWVYLR